MADGGAAIGAGACAGAGAGACLGGGGAAARGGGGAAARAGGDAERPLRGILMEYFNFVYLCNEQVQQ